MKSILLASCVSLALTTPALAQAADEDTPDRQDTINVLGLRPVAKEDLTSSVSVMSAEALDVRQSVFVADQLRAVPGLGISRSGTQGGLTQIRIRGAEANHTLVLLNGIEVSDPVNGESDFGLFSGLNLSRIEVARGEQSALYGSDAVGGVINLVSGSQAGVTAAAEYGSFDTLRARAAYGQSHDNGDFTLSASGYSTDGVDVSGRDGEKDGSESYSILATGNYEFDSTVRTSGVFTYRSTNSQTDPDTDFDGRLDNADRETESDQWLIGGQLLFEALGAEHQFNASFNSVVRENMADGSFSDETTGERTKFAYSPSLEFEASDMTFSIAALLDWESEDYERRGIASAFGDPNQSRNFETFGQAVEARMSTGALSLTASARHDDNDGVFEDADTWRVGAAYQIAPAFRVRASAGEGVKNPTFTELFGFYPGSFIGNPDLKPENSSSWEIGLDHAIGNVEASLTYFEAELENEIYTSYAPPAFLATPLNRTGMSDRSGVEASISWQIATEFSMNASVTNIQSTNDSGVDEIRVPEWTGSVAIDWRSTETEGLRAGLAFDYVGEQLDTDFGTFQTVTLDEYVLVSSTFEYPLNDSLSLTLRGENLLDEETVDVFGYNGTGAAAFIGLKLR